MNQVTQKQGHESEGTVANVSGPWWKEGVAIFSEVTGWIVVPLISALYGGQYLDERYGSGSVFFLGLTGLAFILSCVGIARVGSKYIQRIDEEAKKKKESPHDVANTRNKYE